MSKVQHLLKGPAAEWFSHAQKSIFTWKDLVRKLRDRFSAISNADSLRQQVYSKRQQPGENTMRFIDQFVNLIDQLPETTTEKQSVDYILKVIRTEVARLARTAKVQTLEELSKFVKTNFGLKDKMHDRSLKNQFRTPQSKRVEQLDELSDECLSEDSYECENEIHEVKRADAKKKKMENKNLRKKSDKSPNTFDKPPNTNPSYNKREPDFHCCCGAQRANHVIHSHPNQNSQACSTLTYIDPPNNSQINFLNQTPHRVLVCPFCNGNHAYRECPLPQAQKHKHCFVCKAPNQIASTCPSPNATSLLVHNASAMISNHTQDSQTHTPLQKAQNSNQIPPQYPEMACTDAPMPPFIAYVESLIYFPKRDLRPHASVIANENSLECLLDTGSHVTVIGQNLYEARDWKTPLIPYETRIITADSTQHDTLGVLLLTYQLNYKKRVIPTLVVPIKMRKPILGIDFQMF